LQLTTKHQKRLLHSDIELAKELNADGIHLRSDQITKTTEAKKYNLYTVVSTHTMDEALLAKKLGADAITYSPIFYTPHKGKPKGIEKLKALVEAVDIPVIALGGIVDESQVDKLLCVPNLFGFASIRYFKPSKVDKIKQSSYYHQDAQ